MIRALSISALVLLAACGDDATGSADAATDARPDAGSPRDAGPPPPPWPHDFAATTSLPAPRGLSIGRTIIHLHSPYSHDACDGKGFVDGALADAECLAHFRDALCRLHVDMA